MRFMRVDERYRMLADDSHLPEEVPQDETDEAIARLGDALQAFRDALVDIHRRHDVLDDIVVNLMSSACLDYDEGREWHLDCLADGIERLQEELAECDDDIPSYEDSETILDIGYKPETYGDNGIYAKVIEDSCEQEVVEEIIITHDEPIHRKRTIVWEPVPGSLYSRHSKEIRYEDLPTDERMSRLIRNTKAMRDAQRQ